MLVTFNELNMRHPNVKEIAPDKEILTFFKGSIEEGKIPNNLYYVVGMMKFILMYNCEDKYKDEYKICLELYSKLIE